MVWPGDVIAHRFRRVTAQEDSAGVAHLLQQGFGISSRDLQMLGGDGIGQRHGIIQRLHHDDGAIVGPAFGGDVLARQDGDLALRSGGNLVGKAGVIGDQDALRGRIMLGLAEQVGGDPFRIVLAIGHHQDFRRPGDGVDAHLAEHLALGGGDIGITGADNLVHGGNLCGAISQRRNGLRSAYAIDVGYPCPFGGRQHQGIDAAATGGRDHDDARYAGDLGGYGVHQHR